VQPYNKVFLVKKDFSKLYLDTTLAAFYAEKEK